MVAGCGRVSVFVFFDYKVEDTLNRCLLVVLLSLLYFCLFLPCGQLINDMRRGDGFFNDE